MEEDAINRFKELIIEIQKYEKLRFIGCITTPVIVGFFILKKVNPKLALLNKDKEKILQALEYSIKKGISQLEKNYRDLKESDTYLIYSEKNETIHRVNEFIDGLHFIMKQNILPVNLIELSAETCEKSKGLLTEINKYNEDFVKRKKKEYVDLFKRENLVLDNDQQTAIVTDDKHNLVVAGAGSGKTEVLITRIAYLVKRKPDTIKPERILALAFQNKAALEMRERLKKRYGFDVEIRTFHSLGKKIIEEAYKAKNKVPELKSECSEDWRYQKYIQNLFDKKSVKNKELQNEIIAFMKCYGDDELIKEEADFEKKGEYYNYQKSLTYTALDGTKVKSESERVIINFFLMHNINGSKIKIIYENPALWMKYRDKNGHEYTPKPDFYFPDFDIYLEHWAINKNGKVPEWFSGEDPTKEYVEHMNIKKKRYEENNKVLIETTQAEYETNSFYGHLESRLLDALKKKYPNEKFELTPLSYADLVERVWKECKEFVKTIALNLSRYIVIAKTYNLSPSEIEERLTKEKWTPKQKAFANIAIKIYKAYEEELKKENAIDFSDMINLAVELLKKNKAFYKDTYDHILIDEYQDISKQRYELIKELMNKNSKCKLFCVGDDWQSIMGFAGSNLDFFVHFDKYFEHPARTDLTKNYRSIKSVVDAGACIIRNNNDGQIKKETVSNSDEIRPFLVYSSLHKKEYFVPYYEQTAKHSLDKIKEYVGKGYNYCDFMILSRIAQKPKLRNFITEYAKLLNIPVSEEPDKPNHVHIISVHKSKGLQARVVIILNVDKDLYGFPCELENPDIFETAIQNNDGFREQEERRLFYVAVTRAKEEVIMYTQKCSESKFITEIKDFVTKEELAY